MTIQLSDQEDSSLQYGVVMKHPPYHLRVNKAVDRLLFVNLLREYGQDCKGFTYYSLAGPFLEDLKVMDLFFPDMKLVSLEKNKHTVERQEFHRFNSKLELRNATVRQFVDHEYQPGDRDVFWLDYTKLKYQYFMDFHVVLTKVAPGSVVRITLPAQPEIDIGTLAQRLPEDQLVNIQKQLEERFVSEFEAILPYTAPGAFASRQNFPRMVQQMVRNAASVALDKPGSKEDFLPVQSTCYDDHTQMVSITGIVCSRNEIDALKTRLGTVRFCDFEWQEPKRINVPALSMKERLWIEKHLPIESGKDAGEELCEAIPYWIDDTLKGHKLQLRYYADCYRDYPSFVRIPV